MESEAVEMELEAEVGAKQTDVDAFKPTSLTYVQHFFLDAFLFVLAYIQPGRRYGCDGYRNEGHP